MRAAELIGCHVYDADGQDLGIVHDLHFRVRGRPGGGQACELDALECGGTVRSTARDARMTVAVLLGMLASQQQGNTLVALDAGVSA